MVRVSVVVSGVVEGGWGRREGEVVRDRFGQAVTRPGRHFETDRLSPPWVAGAPAERIAGGRAGWSAARAKSKSVALTVLPAVWEGSVHDLTRRAVKGFPL